MLMDNPENREPLEDAGAHLAKIQAELDAKRKQANILLRRHEDVVPSYTNASDHLMAVQAELEAKRKQANILLGRHEDAIPPHTNAGDHLMALHTQYTEKQEKADTLLRREPPRCSGDRVIALQGGQKKTTVLPSLMRRQQCAGDRIVAIQEERKKR